MRPILALPFVLAFAAPASAFTAINGLDVTPVQGGFEVLSRGGDGPRQVWCAAAEYAQRVQGARNNQRLFILRGYGPAESARGYRGVSFTLAPPQALAAGPRPGSNGNYSVSMNTPGFNLSTAHAWQFCKDALETDDDWPL